MADCTQPSRMGRSRTSLAPQALIRTICPRDLKTRCLTFGLPSRKRSSVFPFVDGAFDAVVSPFDNTFGADQCEKPHSCVRIISYLESGRPVDRIVVSHPISM